MRAQVVVSAALSGLLLAGLARTAAAEDGDPEVSSARTPIVVTDVITGGLIGHCLVTGNEITGAVGLGLFVLAPPIEHAIAGDGLAWGSGGARGLLPLGGGLVGGTLGYILDKDHCERCPYAEVGAAIGIVGGLVVASVLDYRESSDLSSGDPEPMMFSYGGGF